MKKIFKFIFISSILLAVVSFSGCRYCADNVFYYGNYVENRIINGFKKLTDNPAKNKSIYKFIVLTDIHTGGTGNNDTWPLLFKYLDSVKGTPDYPAFCISLGDSADHADIAEYIVYADYLNKLEKEYGIKTYNTIGNHDCYQSGWDHWNKYCYPYTSYYKFETEKFSYYFLDTGTGTLGKTQLEQIKKEMQADPKYKIVSTHYPLYTKTLLFCIEDTTERNELIDLFARTNVKLTLGGHIHKPETNVFDDFLELTLPSFRYQQKWGIVSVDENTASVIAELKE